MMKRLTFIFLAILVSLFVFVSCTQTVKPSTNSNNSNVTNTSKTGNDLIVFGELKAGEYTEGKVLVGYTDRTSALKVVELLNGRIVVDLPEISMISISFNGTVEQAYEKIQKADIQGLKYVEPSYKRELIEPMPVDNSTIQSSKNGVKTFSDGSLRGSEEFSQSLWGIEAIGATEVWPEASGTGVIVAVIDTGVDGTHPDLEGQVIAGYRPATGEDLPAGTDSSYGGAHGTHVAGTIAAKADGKGIVGIAPNAKIMPIVIFDDPELVGGNGFVGDDYVAAGIIWAADNGAKAMNNSWGGWGYSHTLKAAFDYALDHNVVVMVSAGNDHTDQHMLYPAGYPGIIEVAAVEYNGGSYKTTLFSSRSDGIAVGAPGVKILSTVPSDESLGAEGYTVVSAENDGTYDYYDGTSMACPHVTGSVALLLQKYPNAKPWQIRQLLQQTAVDIDDTGWDHNSGYGFINLKNAFVATLPTTGGLTYNIEVTDAYGDWAVPTVFVTMKRVDGAGTSYFAKTDDWGIAHFSNIDAGKYELIIGGPDSYDRVLADFGYGSYYGGFAINYRMEEERQVTEVVNLTTDATKTYAFSSQFQVEFAQELDGASVVVNNLIFGSYDLPFETNMDLSNESGLVELGIVLEESVSEDTTIDGTVTLNGYEIPVSGTVSAGETQTVISDDWGPNAWWTVFGSVE
ncbi:MAG: S8 family serine peptidase [Thermotogaceae bacterium]|nr:S8 family serine peptidase [Thermotogaceae bacterium]